MKLIYRIIRVAHLPDGQVFEKVVEEINSKEIENISLKAKSKYDEEVEKMSSVYFPISPFEYEPSKGIGYAMKLQAVWDTDTGEGGHQKQFIIQTTYRRSEQLDQVIAEKEKELLGELANPQYPVNRFWMTGNSGIGFSDWYELLYQYHIKLLTLTPYGFMDTEILYKVGHRHLGEARKIALSLLNQETKKFSISDDFDRDNPEKGFQQILVLELLNNVGQSLWVDGKPTTVIKAEDQEQEKNLFLRNNYVYDKLDALPSSVNEIEDLWTADHLTVYDYKVMNPYRKYGLVRYVYYLKFISKGGGKDELQLIEEFAHHDLATAKQEALKIYTEKVKDLQGKYSPDILETADAAVEGYNYYLELSEVRGDFNIITEASFSYNGTDITQKDEESRIFEMLKRESFTEGLVDNRQKSCPMKANSRRLPETEDDSSDDDEDDFPF